MEQACGAASAPSHRRLRRRNWRRGCRGSSWSASAPPSASSRRVSSSACMSPASTSLHSTRSTAAPSIAAPLSTAQAGPLRLLRARLTAPAGRACQLRQGAPGGTGRLDSQPQRLSHCLWAPSHCRGRWDGLATSKATDSTASAWSCRPGPRLSHALGRAGPVRPRPKAYRARAFGSQPVTTSLLPGSTWQNKHGELTLTPTFPPFRHKVWLKPSAEQSFLYGNHVLKVTSSR